MRLSRQNDPDVSSHATSAARAPSSSAPAQANASSQDTLPTSSLFGSQNRVTSTASTDGTQPSTAIGGSPRQANGWPRRSISYGGSQQTESITDRYSRTMAEVQEQLESMRELLGGNLADEERRSLATVAESLNQQQAEIEDEFIRFMDDSDEAPSPAWGRRRGGFHLGERQRKQSPSTRSGQSNDDAASEHFKKSAGFVYTIERKSSGSDVWPDMRCPARTPARYRPLDLAAMRGKNKKRAAPEPAIEDDWMRDAEDDDDSTKIVWPMNQLPSEIYYLITESLSRDDIKAMRLTCKEMEHHLSCILFKTVVVPFNTEIYGMLHGLPPRKLDAKGKGKAKAVAPGDVEFWQNSKEEDIYTGYGVDVFRSFGPRMKRFGMSFEVDEEVLAHPPLKGTREDHKSYWGVYQWPYPEYKRFDQVAGLEDAADETPRMKTAFSFLTEVQELALSLDAGLGWLNGPDRSLRSRILGGNHPVFGKTHHVPDRREESAHWLWNYLKDWAARNPGIDLRHCMMSVLRVTTNPNDFAESLAQLPVTSVEPSTPYLYLAGLADPLARPVPMHLLAFDAVVQHEMMQDAGRSDSHGAEPVPATPPVSSFEGGLLYVKEDLIDPERLENYPIVPAELSKLQKEWLLETEWAQRAFLSSWLIAVVDNRLTFQHVHTVNFARISSRFLLSLCREDLWRALPQLEKIALNVIPDCRDVTKDNAGFVDTPRIMPAGAVWLVHKLIADMFALRSTIKSIEVGWADGGERAEGLLARNKLLMPAAILPPEWLGSAENMTDKHLLEVRMLRLPHVKILKLKNCWITPHALKHFVKEHAGLEHLCLESVSLTAEPVNNNGPNPQQVMAMAQQTQGPLMPQHANVVAQPAQAGGQWNHQAHHTFLQAVQNVNNLAAAAGINVQAQNQQSNTGDWLNPRVGSWPHVLDCISPGITLAAAGCTSCPVNLPAAIPGHALQTLELRSAGYCRLNNARLDESTVPPLTFGGGSPWFTKRYAAFSKLMLNARGMMMAEIVQSFPQSEEQALTAGFDLELGWPARWAAEVEAPTFDGCLPGGTGRFHGVITRSSRVVPLEEE